MSNSNTIEATLFCSMHQVDLHFIELLRDNGLIQTSIVSGALYIPEEELPVVEKMMRLHFDMDINIEGIETIHYLLGKIEQMQSEIRALRNRVAIYEYLNELS